MELTKEDQALLNTQFDPETEKLAAAQAAQIQEAYQYGFAKIAKEVADEKDEDEKKEKEEPKKDEKMDDESEKAAAELGAFIERGFFDGLRKLGSERHQDEGYYLAPFINGKIEEIKEAGAMDFARKAVTAVKDYTTQAGRQVATGARQAKSAITGRSGAPGMPDIAFTGAQRKAIGGEAAKNLGAGLGKLAPHAALGAGAIYGGAKLVGGSKEPAQ